MSEYFKSLILGQHFIELPKSTLPASVANTDGNYQFFCSSSEVKVTDTWIADKPTVLLGTGGVASVNYGEERFAYSTDTWAIRAASNDITIKYLYRLLQKNLALIDYKGFEGSGLKHLRKGFVKQLNVQVPTSPFVESKIINILDTIDDTIIHTEALIEKYQHIKAGMMNDLFTRGVLPDGTLRPTRDKAPELYYETPIGWIPKEWEIRTIQSLNDSNSAITIGPFGSDLVASDYRIDGIPVVFVRDVKENGFVWNSNTYVEYKKAQKLSSHTVKSGDILSTKMGLPPCISCIYPEWMNEGIITADIVRLRLKIHDVNSQWLTSTLNFDRSRRQVAAITAGVTRPKITLGDYRKLLLALPKIEEQNLIALKIEKIQLFLNAENKIHTNLLNQKLGLMHDLLTGQVRVKTAQE
jgi:type I restriction enzyme S subunit